MKKSRSKQKEQIKSFQARNLLPNIDSIFSAHDRRELVKDKLIELALANDLSVTECYRQPKGTLSLISQVIMGHSYEEGKQTVRTVPRELLNYRVEIESIDRPGGKWPIEFKAGHEYRGRDRVVGNKDPQRIRVQEEVWVLPSGEEKDHDFVPLQDAWILMGQAGEFCAHAPSPRIQERIWKFREVPPTPKDCDEPQKAKPKRGRPKKMATQTGAEA